MKALIDGDVIRYRCGFAAERKIYKVYLRGTEDEFGPVGTFLSNAEANGFINGESDYYIVSEVIPEPIENCLHSVKLQIQSIINELDASEWKIYLTGPNQFREKRATIKPYKGNRDPLHKPFYYKEIGDYLVKYWGAQFIEYYEADDALAMDQWAYYKIGMEQYAGPTDDFDTYFPSIICTIDKDLDQVPGWHYNFVKKEKYWVTEAQANHWFYVQLIAGDGTDNIQGIPGYGKAKAEKAIKDCKTDKEKFDVAFKLYQKAYGANAMDALLETADLIYMVREKDKKWIPPI